MGTEFLNRGTREEVYLFYNGKTLVKAEFLHERKY
jgi:hypothetical protein